jgi:hypothetical protein
VSLVRFRIFAASHLENARVLYSRLVIKVKSVEDQRLVLRVKNPPVGLAGPTAAIYIENIGDIELAGRPLAREGRGQKQETVHRHRVFVPGRPLNRRPSTAAPRYLRACAHARHGGSPTLLASPGKTVQPAGAGP